MIEQCRRLMIQIVGGLFKSIDGVTISVRNNLVEGNQEGVCDVHAPSLSVCCVLEKPLSLSKAV